jgi:hypothetical protein
MSSIFIAGLHQCIASPEENMLPQYPVTLSLALVVETSLKDVYAYY